jgi:hypothetical protein
MNRQAEANSKPTSDAPAWQALPVGLSRRIRPSLPVTSWLIFFAAGWFAAPAAAQLYDSLDTHPPRWHLDGSDCDARVTKQGHLSDGGIGGGACESITFTAGHGSEVRLVYPIEPVMPLDDLTANVAVMSARGGARIGFRVRYPYLQDPETRRPAAVIVYGANYQSLGQFASIGVGMIERPLRMKVIALRREHGSDADLSDAYVDAVVINAYSGPGTTHLRMDELRVEGLIPISDTNSVGRRLERDRATSLRMSEDSVLIADSRTPFPLGRVTRILQHNGEPLAWVRSLGFDAVLLAGPPDAEILGEAIRSRVKVYAPPPSAPDPSIQSLLDPVAAWYVGADEVLDRRQINQTELTCRRLRSWPSQWQRPLVAAPSESWRRYASLLDGVIQDLPPRNRGLGGGEEVAQMMEVRRRIGDRVAGGVGIVSMPPEAMVRQTESIADLIGAPRPQAFRWHSMWLQAMRSLESAPAAMLFRSTRPLSSGQPLDNQRSMALSYVNRMIAMIAPWVASSTPAAPPQVVGAPYRCTRLTGGPTELLILTSIANRGSEVLAGDGTTLEIQLTPSDAAKTVWRLTHFSAERISPEVTSTGARLQVVSPDAVELIVLSSDTAVGGALATSAQRFARQAGLDRWQLVSDLVERTRANWQTATSTRASSGRVPSNLMEVATRTLTDAEPMYRAGDIDASLRMARRADAWAMRSEWQLAEALMPDWPRPTSCPPIDLGSPALQSFWRPLMDDQGWGINRMTSGSLDDPNWMDEHRWSVGRRMVTQADSRVEHINRGTFEGPGALRARVVPIADDPLHGGYEGTVIQIRSPSVRVAAGSAIRIDTQVRTIGFGGPHQGLLVYDTIGGQEMGVLVRARPDWTPVRLYRQTQQETEVHVMFELIGAGEATIDEVELRVWEPETIRRPPLTPIAERTPIGEIESDESTKR